MRNFTLFGSGPSFEVPFFLLYKPLCLDDLSCA